MLAGVHFPDHSEYVGAAFLVFIALMLIYLAIMAFKLARVERELIELNQLADRLVSTAPQDGDRQPEPAR